LFVSNDKACLGPIPEVMAPAHLERQLSKDRLLQLNLNQVYFGPRAARVERAPQGAVAKSQREVSLSEGALLAGLAKAPNAYSPTEHPEKALKRRNVVLQSMENAGIIDTETRLKEQGKTLGLDVYKREIIPSVASYIDLVMKEAADQHHLSIDELKRGGYRIVVNIDETIQQIAYEEFKKEDYFPGNTAGIEGAFVMMDQNTGKIVTAIGGRD